MHHKPQIPACAALLAAGYAFDAHALRMECCVGYVNGVPQRVCYGDGGGGSGGGTDPGGGGDRGGIWVSVPGKPGVRINLTQKKVESDNVSCEDIVEVRAREVQVVLMRDPYVSIGTEFTLTMSYSKET